MRENARPTDWYSGSWPRSALLTLSSTLRPVGGSTDRRSERRTNHLRFQRHMLRGTKCSNVHWLRRQPDKCKTCCHLALQLSRVAPQRARGGICFSGSAEKDSGNSDANPPYPAPSRPAPPHFVTQLTTSLSPSSFIFFFYHRLLILPLTYIASLCLIV
ncbi:hypothetical protein BDD12DRAFT_245712 [Trichophaea hybrida]|nr:hypothetical protein BDD12DRAFT_245712 [Trichophaea hybrida]